MNGKCDWMKCREPSELILKHDDEDIELCDIHWQQHCKDNTLRVSKYRNRKKEI